MTEIYPIISETEREAVCSRFSVPYSRETFLYCASREGEIISVCAFSIDGDGKVAKISAKASKSLPDSLDVELLVAHALICTLCRTDVKIIKFDADNFSDDFLKWLGIGKNRKIAI